MMQTLRKYMKHILWIVAVCFIATIIFSWGMGGFKKKGFQAERGIIGIINGHKIQYKQFMLALEQEYEKIKEQNESEEISEYRRSAIRDQVWQSIIQEILMAQEIRRLGIQASPEEIVFHMRNNPPDFIRSHEQFQTEGEFDITKYREALNDPRNYDSWIPLENYFRNTLPVMKLQQQIISTVRLTDSEVREAYRRDNEKVNAKYIFFDPNKVSLENIEVSDSEIEKYYEEHKDDYRELEKRKIQYILFEAKPSKDDSIQTRNDIQDILEQIRSGADFGELAKEYSDDKGTASKEGDLGFFGKGAMVKPFEEAAFSAKIREVVGPVETQFGMHIIQVLARKKEEGETKIHARHILLKYKISPETYDALHEKSQFFYDEVIKTKGKQFSELAEQQKLEIKETAFFQSGGFIPGIGMAARVNYFAFQESEGWISQPMRANENIIIFKILEIQKAQLKPLESVKNSIQNIIEKEKRKKRSGEICRQIRNKIENGTPFEEAVLEDSLNVLETGFFTLNSYIPRIGKDAKFSGSAFQLDIDEVSQPVEGQKGYFLIKAIDRAEFDEKSFEAQKEEKKKELLQKRQQQIYTAWFNNLKEKADIEDFRNQYF